MAQQTGWFRRMALATNAAWSAGTQAFRRLYDDPGAVMGGAAPWGGLAVPGDPTSAGNTSGPVRAAWYRLLWGYYDNSAFENLAAWQSYKGHYQLYRLMRSVYNPTRRLVDFYAGAVYPGVLSEDGSTLPDGVPLAVPLAEDTPPELRAAIAQFWAWTNWQASKAVYVRYGAATGNVLVEVVDDLERAKVTANVVWPGLVRALVLDASGNVKAYSLEYLAIDDAGTRYRYRKDVDPDLVAFYRDDEPYDYGDGASYANPYGFTPAVWTKHKSIGGDFGIPAIYGSIGKIDELNSIASKIHDQVHKIVAAPVVLWSSGGVGKAFQDAAKRGNTNDFSDKAEERDHLLYLQGPADGHVDSLAGSLPLADAKLYVDQLLAELEQDHPEIAFNRELRAMSTLTGPAASRVMSDVASALAESAANYDSGSTKLFQMAVAIAGWRANRGDWGPGPLSRQQALFQPFDLDSYAAGTLDIAIVPRPLLTPTGLEKIQMEQAQVALEQQKQALAAATGAVTNIRVAEV